MAVIKAQLDGYDVHLGDQVYGLLRGTGTITAVQPDGTFEVSFMAGGSPQLFLKDGYLGKSKRVFWHDPFIVIPPKSINMWSSYKKLTQAVCGEIADLVQKGLVHE